MAQQKLETKPDSTFSHNMQKFILEEKMMQPEHDILFSTKTKCSQNWTFFSIETSKLDDIPKNKKIK